MSNKHTPGTWAVVASGVRHVGIKAGLKSVAKVSITNTDFGHNARLISAAPEYHDAADEILQAVTANAAPINPLAALEEMSISGDHITLDAGLVLALLKAHAKATGEQP